MPRFRVILIDGNRTPEVVLAPFEQPPDPGDTVKLPQGQRVIVRHVIGAVRDGIAGIVLASPAQPAA